MTKKEVLQKVAGKLNNLGDEVLKASGQHFFAPSYSERIDQAFYKAKIWPWYRKKKKNKKND